MHKELIGGLDRSTGTSEAESLYNKQIALESRHAGQGFAKAIADAQENIRKGKGGRLRPAERMIALWFGEMESVVRQAVKIAKASPDKVSAHYAPGLALVVGTSPKIATATAMMTMISRVMRDPSGSSYTSCATEIGNLLQAESEVIAMRKLLRQRTKRCREAGDLAGIRRASRTRKKVNEFGDRHLIHKAAANMTAAEGMILETRGKIERTRAGAWLIELVKQTCIIVKQDKTEVDAFRVAKEPGEKKRRLVLYAHPDMLAHLDKGIKARAAIRPRCPVMVVQPPSWADTQAGGYLVIRKGIVANAGPMHKAELARYDMSRTYAGIDAMNRPAYRMNGPILDTFKHLWCEEQSCPVLPAQEDPAAPTFPHSDSVPKNEYYRWKRSEEGAAWLKSVEGSRWRALWRGHISRVRELKADRKGMVMLMGAAKDAGTSAFWIPNRLQCQGRQQPMTQHLNGHATDLAEAMMLFDRPVEPLDDGREFMALQLANAWGLDGWDKRPLAQRVRFVDEHRQMIEAVARDPLKNREWMMGDKKTRWQFLAACMAWHNPEMARHAPSSIDCSCNGLQHSAAMSRDENLGRLVNLVDTGRRENVHGDAAALLLKRVQADAAKGDKWGTQMVGQVDSNLCKQPVMTHTYGVTHRGRVEQFAGKLEDRGWTSPSGGPSPEAYWASSYLAKMMPDVMNDLGRSAMDMMLWQQESVKRIIRQTNQPIGWLTPIIGFPVVIEKLQEKTRQIRTCEHRLSMFVPVEDMVIDCDATVTAIAAMHTHSLDGTHNMLNAMESARRDIDYRSKHDQFTTHSGRMRELKKIVADQFVELHRSDLRLDLANQWIERYKVDLPPLPERGTLDLNGVITNPYFAS